MDELTERMLKEKTTIDNIDYYSVRVFAHLTKRSEQSVRKLTLHGNRLGLLKSIKMARSVFIPCSELVNYNFCLAGTSGATIKFDAEANERTEFI